MKLVIREEALDDLDGVYDWIAIDNQAAAVRVVRVLRESMNRILLPELVKIGRPGRRKGTRELIEWPYIIVYKVSDDRELVTILSVVHGAWIKKPL
jgi:plasmid stabilization system protein ParE